MDPEPIPTPPQPKKPIVLIIFAILLFLSTIFLAYQNLQLKKQILILQTTPTPPTSLTTPTPDPTENWKTHRSEKYYLQFKYPNDIPVEIIQTDSANSIQFIFAKSAPNSFTIKASTKYPPNQSRYLIDTEPSETKEIFGEKWNVYLLSADEGLQLEKNNVLYSVIYPNSREKLVYQILSTFKFLEQQGAEVGRMNAAVIAYLTAKGHDPSTITITGNEILGNDPNKFIVSWNRGGPAGNILIVGKVNGQWIVPDDATRCEWIKNSTVDENTKAFLGGPSCGY